MMLVGVLQLLNNAEYAAVVGAERLHAQALLGIDTFGSIWAAGLILFGTHLLLLGYLAYRAEYVPKVIGVLLIVAGLGYVSDSFGPVLTSGYSVELAAFTFVGEVVLLFWLLIKGRHIALENAASSTAN